MGDKKDKEGCQVGKEGRDQVGREGAREGLKEDAREVGGIDAWMEGG